METAKSRYTVEFSEDSIAILYDHDEVLYWIEDEWIEDPTIVLSIANVIYLSQRNPQALEKLDVFHKIQNRIEVIK